MGVEVGAIDLPFETTTDELLEVIRQRIDSDDGIQLMWPLPDHIDAMQAYKSIPIEKDVDGAHWIGSSEIGGGLRNCEVSMSPENSSAPWMPGQKN